MRENPEMELVFCEIHDFFDFNFCSVSGDLFVFGVKNKRPCHDMHVFCPQVEKMTEFKTDLCFLAHFCWSYLAVWKKLEFYCVNLTCKVFGVVLAAVLEAQVRMFPSQKLESRAWSCGSLMSAARDVAAEGAVGAAASLRQDAALLDQRLQDLSAEELEQLLQDLCF